MRSMGRIILALTILTLVAADAQAQGVFRNQRLFAVPAPSAGPGQAAKVIIDGNLDDWDLSGEILTYVVESSMAYQSARTAIMYDDDALYISSRVADPTPMLNRADPAVNPDFGWDGDAFQFRLCLNPARTYPINLERTSPDANTEDLVHMTLWYYTDGKKPVLHLKYGMNFHDAHGYHKGIVPDDKFQAAYKAWPDGKGYTFEYRIPWSTLGGPRPLKAGDLAASAIQIQWSDATGAHSFGGGWAVDLMSHAGFTYQATHAWGKIIFAEKGHLPKELTQEGVAPARKMPLSFPLELPKEQVTSVTLIDANGDRVRHIIAAEQRPAGKITESWNGLDDGGNVLPAGEYTWKGVYHDPVKTRFVLSVSNSGSPPYNTPDGKGAWGGDWGTPMDVCFAGDKALLVWNGSEAGTGLIMVDANLRKQWGYRIGGSQLATDGNWVFVYLPAEKQLRAYAVADGRQVNFLRGELWAEHNAGKATLCTGLAWQGGKLYVAHDAVKPDPNADANADAVVSEVVEYDAVQGAIGRRIPTPAITWLAAAGNGSLLAISQGALCRFNVADGKLTTLATDHLDHPQAVAACPDGSLYVSNVGNLHNVSVFDKAGKYLRSIGKEGGRALLPEPNTPGNLSRSRAGKWDGQTLLCPRGLAFDAAGRLWVAEHDFSPKRISIWDPATGKLVDETFGPCFVSTPVCMDPADPTRVYCQNVEWEVDLDKGTWKPAAVMIEARADTPYFWPHGVNNSVFTAANGKQYMSECSGGRDSLRGQFLWVRRGDHFEAVAGVIPPAATLSWRPGAKDYKEAAKMPWLFWEDRNGDGVIQEDETRQTKLRPNNAHAVVDANLNFYSTSMYGGLYWERISPAKILDTGVPLYDDNSIVHYDYGKGGRNYTSDLAVNPADGSVLFYAGTDIKLMNAPGGLWPITYWTGDGKMAWRNRLGCRWHDMYEYPIPKAGELYGCTRCMGITDGITGFSCYFGQAQLLTTDGVPIGTIMKDGRSGEVGPDMIQCEWFTGQLVKIKDGRWFILAGDQDGRVLEVLGLNSLKRFEGKLTITPQDSEAAAKALAEWSAQKASQQSLVLARYPSKPNWLDIHGVRVDLDAQRGFVVKTAYDANNLHVRYEVRSPNELTNSTQELNMIFKGGNVMDIQLATDPAADPNRPAPVPGDIRILVTRRDGKGVAVVYRPKVTNFDGTATVFTSPTGKESIDVIEVWNDVALTYEKVDGGFNAVVSLPLARLGLAPRPGTAMKMDVGYIFGNETGNTTAVRTYWTNHSFTAGVVQDVPNESRLEPARWGRAAVE